MLPIRGPFSRYRYSQPTDIGTLVQFSTHTQTTLSSGSGKYSGFGNNVATATGSTGYVSFAFTALLQSALKYYWEFLFESNPSSTQTPFCGITASSPTSGVPPGGASNTTDFGLFAQSSSQLYLYVNGSQQNTMSGSTVSGSIVSIAWDMPNGNMWYGLNGVWRTGSPTTNATPDFSGLNTSTQRGIGFSGFQSPDSVCIATRAAEMTYMNTMMAYAPGWHTPGS